MIKQERGQLYQPEIIAQELVKQVRVLMARVVSLCDSNQDIPRDAFQEAFIHFVQVFLISLEETLKQIQAIETWEDFLNKIFLCLSRFTLQELIEREPSEEEEEYFLTYFRSHFELLRKEMKTLPPQQDFPFSQEIQQFLEESTHALEQYFRSLSS